MSGFKPLSQPCCLYFIPPRRQPRMFVRSAALVVIAASALAAQTERRSIKGATVAVYNLVGRLKATAGSGDAVVVDITRGGPDSAKLKIETGPIRDRQT